MKNTNNFFFKRLKTFTIILALALSAGLNAQDFDDDVDDTGAAPIDGGISILLAAGALYGIRKLRNNKH